MTQIKMAPENHKPSKAPLPADTGKKPGAQPDEATPPTEIKKQ